MRIETPETKARAVPERWAEKYYHGGGWDEGREETYEKLLELRGIGEATPSEIAQVIGNGSWTRTECESCGVLDVPVVVVDLNESYQSVRFCRDCAAKVFASFEAADPTYEPEHSARVAADALADGGDPRGAAINAVLDCKG